MTVRIVLAFTFGLFLSLPANAQDLLGTVTGTVGDQPASWSIHAAEGHSSPGVWINMGPGMDGVTFFAKSDEATESDVLNLSFGVMQATGTMILFNAEGYYRRGDPATAYSAPTDEGIAYTLTLVEEVAGGLHVQGSFSGDFFLTSNSGEVDKSQSVAIAGTFDVVVPPN
jgi:hypothetical protein